MSDFLTNVNADWFRSRISGVIFCVLAVFVVLISRLFYLQVVQGDELRRLSENNRIRLQSIDAPRGLVFDRNGRLLVDNRPSFGVAVIPKDARPMADVLSKLSKLLDVPEEDFIQKVKRQQGASPYKPVLLMQDIGRDALAAIAVNKFDLPGVTIEVKPLRHYIDKQFAAHLVGYLGEISAAELKMKKYADNRGGDYIGKFGIEKTYEKLLRGERGGRQVEVNARGRNVRVIDTVDAIPGYNLHLTIDYEVQKKAESLLADKAGAVLAIIPSTGELLAMASSPSFDQNIFVSGMSHKEWQDLSTNPLRPMENKAIQGTYPPASVYKIITAMAGLEEGVIDENTVFECNGSIWYGDRAFRCWRRGGHGAITLNTALAESCDVYFYQVGQKLGVDRLAWYAKACGFANPTEIDLDHESSGLIPTAAWKYARTGVPWQSGETLSIAIGQGYNLVTPLQQLSMISAIANGGRLMKPEIIQYAAVPENDLIFRPEPRELGVLPVSEKNLEIIKKGLWTVVNKRKGTAWQARLKNTDIEMCGKTGTAQLVGRARVKEQDEEKLAGHLKSHAWFVAYAPAENPEIAVTVIVEHGKHGSSTAAPIAREIIQTYLLPDKPDSEEMVKR
ncbi:MAG: penicillin-binding protein 2 [Desulfobacterales bacterium]|nr:penicillin-binding protein 2 [Desulfobacterales bacterium]